MTAGAGVTGNGSASVIITGTAAQINAALAGLAYTGNPDFNGGDTLTVATSDGTATDTDTIAITVNPVNDAPALNLDADSSTTGGVDYLTAFTDGGPAVAIVDTDVLITDSDDIELTSATVTLTNPDTDDVLLFNGSPAGRHHGFPLRSRHRHPHAHWHRVTAAYQTALQQITFDNTGTNPSTETRIIDVVVNDGTVASNLAHAIVEVTQVNNSAPTLDLDGNNSTLPGTSYRTTFTENGTPVAIADTDTLIGDPDIGSTIRFSHHHADEPADRRSADRHAAVAGRHHRFRLRPGHRNPDALQRRFVRRLRDCAGGDPLQRGWRHSGCGNPHHSSRRQ